jgi:transposase-like protein
MDREELKRLTKEEMGWRIREGVKAAIGQALEEEMTEHLAVGYEGTPSCRRERNGFYTRDLITPAGKMAQLWVPWDREGTFLTEVFARYKRMTGEVAVHLGLGPQRGGGAGDVPLRVLHPQGGGGGL